MASNKDQPLGLKHLRRKQRDNAKAPSVVSIQVIGNGGEGSPQALMIVADASRYMFNCGEGTQRLCHEHKIKYVRLENIFITHKSWKNVGGLLDMALSLQEAKVPRIAIHGPPGVDSIFTEARKFAPLRNMSIEGRKSMTYPFVDDVMSVDVVELFNVTRTTDVSYCYVCKFRVAERKLDFEKAVELNLPRGPWIGMLKNGESVTLEDGRTIMPDDVLDPPEKPQIVLILECPTVHHITSLVTDPTLSQILVDGDISVELIAHLTPHDVLLSPAYQQWMQKFASSCHHLKFNSDNDGVSFERLHRLQAKLNLIDSSIFPLLPQQVEYDKNMQYFQPSGGEGNVAKAYSNLRYHLRPWRSRGFERSCVVLDTEAYLAEIEGRADLDEKIKSLAEIDATRATLPVVQYPEVVMLGTGSSIPSKERNVSGILVHISGGNVVLLDCGEDTYGQIVRNYGRAGAADILCRLSCIFISHMHADHHMGLLAIIEARQKALASAAIGEQKQQPLYLLGPRKMRFWLDLCQQQSFGESLQTAQFVSLHDLTPSELRMWPHSSAQDADSALRETIASILEMSLVVPVPVIHANSNNAFGISLHHKDGWKLVYSGDTMPCEALIDAGKNCDILIHEATMEDEMEEDAQHKTHCTTSQAIEVGRRMNAKFTLLTHFSQRYPKVPVFTDKFTNNVGIAFDNMRVRLDNIHRLGHFQQPLQTIFLESCNELEERTEKRKIQKMRVDGVVPDLICKKAKVGENE